VVRVVLLTPDFPPAPGGIQVLMHRLVVNAHRLSVRVVSRRSAGAKSFDEAEPLDVRRAGQAGAGPRSNLALNARGLAEALAFRPRAVVSAHIVTSPSARFIQRAMRVPFVQYLHADELRTRPRLGRFAVRAADAVIAVSSYTAGMAVAAGAEPSRVHTIPNGVDLPMAGGARTSAPPTIVTVARLVRRYKGHDVLIRALPLVLERVPEVRWEVIGDGSLRGELEEMASAYGLEGVVRFAGQVSDEERDALLDRAHVFAMPSRLPEEGTGGEGFGIVYLEAAAHGLPVVAGNVAGAPEAVVDGETGVLVDPTDHVAVAGALIELLLDSERAQRLGRAGAERAREFAWPRVARQVEDLLLSLVTERQGSRG
jgi:phosphatidyl-myo-inositol dimannoside synthase